MQATGLFMWYLLPINYEWDDIEFERVKKDIVTVIIVSANNQSYDTTTPPTNLVNLVNDYSLSEAIFIHRPSKRWFADDRGLLWKARIFQILSPWCNKGS